MKEVARVYLSSNGKEFLIYDGNDNLISVVSSDNSAYAGNVVADTVKSEAESE